MTLDLGANFIFPDLVRFKVWAPLHSTLLLKIDGRPPIPMHKDEKGYFQIDVKDLKEGDLYSYILSNGNLRPDPVSRFLPQGPSGPTAILKPDFLWKDSDWKRPLQKDLIFYECHVGTFTSDGTFNGIIEKLPHLKKLGITCLSLMPIAQFPGRCNWGYDWSSAYAPHNSYGSPNELKKLIDSCHEAEIAVCLDVVYNHMGPKNCVLSDFGPYLTDAHKTYWGHGINFDGVYSDEVRHFFLQNAIYWVDEFHFDALRLDATHAILDFSATPFIEQLCSALANKAYIIVENNINNSRLIRPITEGGYGAHALWNDDFHHALHVAITHEKQGYYEEFQGGLLDLKTVLQNSVVYDGTRYSPFRKLTYGKSFDKIEPEKLIDFLQNHDQVGNRPHCDRLILPFDLQKAAGLLTLLSPYLPMLFMGQEYGEEAPFEYFVDFDDKNLTEAIFEGRKKEFQYATNEIPYPDYLAFLHSKLKWKINQQLLSLYQHLIAFRKTLPPIKRDQIKIEGEENWLTIEYNEKFLIFFSLSDAIFDLPHEAKLLFHTEQKEFGGNDSVKFEGKKFSSNCPVGAVFKRT